MEYPKRKEGKLYDEVDELGEPTGRRFTDNETDGFNNCHDQFSSVLRSRCEGIEDVIYKAFKEYVSSGKGEEINHNGIVAKAIRKHILEGL